MAANFRNPLDSGSPNHRGNHVQLDYRVPTNPPNHPAVTVVAGVNKNPMGINAAWAGNYKQPNS
jgi:hypothetical protein